MIKIKYHVAPFLLSLMPFVTDVAMADNKLSSWSLKGFGTLAATGTDTNKIGFYRDKSQTQELIAGGE